MIVAILIAASQISSVDLWSFMRQPENGFTYPSSVSSAHTFGSPDHTNGSRRVVKEDLAAIEAIFEAYHERVFFASEGLSNNWDVAEYGPRATTDTRLRDVSFAASNGGERVSFQYAPGSRFMPGTMRFAETNLVNVYPTVIQDLSYNGDGNAKLLDRGVTWGDNLGRSVWWACSQFDYAEMPEPFDWTHEWPDSSSFTSNFVPIRAFDSSGHSYPGDTEQSQLHFADALLGPVMQREQDWTSALYPRDYTFVGTNSVFRQLSKVFGCSEDLEYAGFTQRLVPDEYLTMDVGTRQYDLGSFDSPFTDESYMKLMEWNPWFGMPDVQPGGVGYGWVDLPFGVSPVTGGVVPAEVLAYGGTTYEWLGSLRVDLSVPDEVAEQNPSDAVVEGYSVADFTCYADDSGTVTNGEWGYVWTSFPLLYRKVDMITNSVTTNVSYLASTARILACHDRTMEVPVMDVYADCHVSNRYETCERSSHSHKTESYSIAVDPYTMSFTFDEPVRLRDLDYGTAELWSTTRVEYAWAPNEFDCARLEQPYAGASAGFMAIESTDPFIGDVFYSDVPENRSYAGSERPATLVASHDPVTDTFVYGLEFEDGETLKFREEDILEWCVYLSGMASVHGTAAFSAYGEASAWHTVHPYAQEVEFRKLFPAYTPGLRGASRVRSAVCPVVASVVVDYGLYGDGYDVLEPPFSYDDLEYAMHSWGLEYACDIPSFSAWSALSTFPTAYSAMRRKVLAELIDEIIPSSLYGIIPVGIGYYDISSLASQCEGGTISSNVHIDEDIGDRARLLVVYDEDGSCIGFKFPDSIAPDRIRSGASSSIDFTLVTDDVSEEVQPLFTLPTAKSATGRTSGGIVADWDFHALKTERNNQ